MRYAVPIQAFEELIGMGLWVGHQFECQGEPLIVASIGQAETTATGERFIPIEVVGTN